MVACLLVWLFVCMLECNFLSLACCLLPAAYVRTHKTKSFTFTSIHFAFGKAKLFTFTPIHFGLAKAGQVFIAGSLPASTSLISPPSYLSPAVLPKDCPLQVLQRLHFLQLCSACLPKKRRTPPALIPSFPALLARRPSGWPQRSFPLLGSIRSVVRR